MHQANNLNAILSYYAKPGMLSDPGEYAGMFMTLPENTEKLVNTLQGLVLHIFWAERYGVTLAEDRKNEVQIRGIRRKIARLLEIDSRPLTEARSPGQKLVGNCRDFALLLASMLQVQEVPARARCGFGTYFTPNRFEDHWMTEIWSTTASRWVQVDPQLDATQCEVLKIRFDPLDMPPGQFILAGKAWQLCRQGKKNPDDFGIFEFHGWDFVRGNVMRDILALNKIEVLPWDFWGLMKTPVAESTPDQLALIDQAAALTLAGNAAFDQVFALVAEQPGLQAPPEWLE